MAVMRVSSSEFRVKMKDFANSIEEEQHRIVVTRHGGRMFVVMSYEDFEFVQKHKPQPTPRPVPDPVPDPLEGIEEPGSLRTEDIQRWLTKTADIEDNPWLDGWRRRARLEIAARRLFERTTARSESERAVEEQQGDEPTRAPAVPAASAAPPNPAPADPPERAAAASPPSRTDPPRERS